MWRGDFYPSELEPDQWLGHYAKRFGCVEADESFLKLPERATLVEWLRTTDEHFHICLRMPRSITHEKKLKHCETQLTTLQTRFGSLGERLGPLVFQLPRRWRCNLARLHGLLDVLSSDFRYVFEFGHNSWYCTEVFDVLSRYNAAYVLSDRGDDTSAPTRTANFSMLRLHAPTDKAAGHFDPRHLRRWAIRSLSLQRDGDVYLIFDDAGDGRSLQNAQHITGYF